MNLKKECEVKALSNEEFQKLVLEKLDEHTKLLNAIEHRVNVNGADIERMSNDVAHMQGDMKSIKNVIDIVEQVTAQNWVDITKMKKAQ